MPKRSLTAITIGRLKLPAKGQVVVFDAGHPGFGIRLSHGGTRTWVGFFRFKGKGRWLTFGTWPKVSLSEARDAWRAARDRLDMGQDPASPDKIATSGNTVEAIVAEWLKRDQATNRSAKDVARTMRKYVVPAWGDRPIRSITKGDAIALVDSVNDLGFPVAANRLRSHTHRMFQWAAGRDYVDANPVVAIERSKEKPRERKLSDSEIRLVWLAAGETTWPWCQIVRLLILTACRRGEIADLRWSEVVSIGGKLDHLALPGSRTKNGLPRDVPLSAPAVAIMKHTYRMKGDRVFSTTGGKSSVSGFSKAKKRLDAEVAKLNGEPIEPWHIHDLRRTIASKLQKKPFAVPPIVIEAALGHVGGKSGIVGTYQQASFDEEARDALDAWARHVTELVEPTPANVVELVA